MNLIERLTSDTPLAATAAITATEVNDPLVLQELKTLNNRLLLLSAVIANLNNTLGEFYDRVIPDGVRRI